MTPLTNRVPVDVEMLANHGLHSEALRDALAPLRAEVCDSFRPRDEFAKAVGQGGGVPGGKVNTRFTDHFSQSSEVGNNHGTPARHELGGNQPENFTTQRRHHDCIHIL